MSPHPSQEARRKLKGAKVLSEFDMGQGSRKRATIGGDGHQDKTKGATKNKAKNENVHKAGNKAGTKDNRDRNTETKSIEKQNQAKDKGGAEDNGDGYHQAGTKTGVGSKGTDGARGQVQEADGERDSDKDATNAKQSGE